MFLQKFTRISSYFSKFTQNIPIYPNFWNEKFKSKFQKNTKIILETLQETAQRAPAYRFVEYMSIRHLNSTGKIDWEIRCFFQLNSHFSRSYRHDSIVSQRNDNDANKFDSKGPSGVNGGAHSSRTPTEVKTEFTNTENRDSYT